MYKGYFLMAYFIVSLLLAYIAYPNLKLVSLFTSVNLDVGEVIENK
jgi:hypothetical protein